MSRALVLALSLLAVAALGTVEVRAAAFATPQLAALVTDERVAEISGMAASRRSDDLFWVLNDSHKPAQLYALGTDGKVHAEITVQGRVNTDWEDLASYELDGEPMLLIADTGDNGGVRTELSLVALAEPEFGATGAGEPVRPRWVLRFRWPDGPRDCEAMAVDARAREVLLLSKKRVPAQLFRLPLAPPADPATVVVAEQIALLPNVPQPGAAQLARDPAFWRYRGQITAMDVDAAALRMVVLSYTDAYLYTRRAGEAWRDALSRVPQALGLPALPQPEAVAFDRAGRAIWVSSERLPAPLIRIAPAE